MTCACLRGHKYFKALNQTKDIKKGIKTGIFQTNKSPNNAS